MHRQRKIKFWKVKVKVGWEVCALLNAFLVVKKTKYAVRRLCSKQFARKRVRWLNASDSWPFNNLPTASRSSTTCWAQ